MESVPRNRGVSRRSLMQGIALGTASVAHTSVSSRASNAMDEIPALVDEALDSLDLRSVILTVHNETGEMYTIVRGESEHGTPATADMHFRIGAVSITYVGVVLLKLADDGVIELDEPISTWLSGYPDADAVTPRMLAQMTAGYPDYVQNEAFNDTLYRNPFRSFEVEELIQFGLELPRTFQPGTNWDYSHTNIAILAQVLEAASGVDLADLMADLVFSPLGLEHTYISELPHMSTPTLHAYSSERREALGIEPGVPFYEETTTWSPSWTLPPGAIHYSTIADVASSFRQLGQGAILSESAFAELTSDSLIGFGSPMEGCPNCHTLDSVYSYGIGLVISNGWYVQNPLFAGCGATVATLPEAGYTIAAAVTFAEAAFDDEGNYTNGNSSQTIVNQLSQLLVPDNPMLLGQAR